MTVPLAFLGPVQQGLAANSAGKYTRKAMKQNARGVRGDVLEQNDRIRTAARLQMGRQLVEQGASGFAVGTGSAYDALYESAVEREIDLATTRRQGEMKARGFQQEGELARAQGRSALVGGFISGAAAALEQAQKAATFGAGG